MTYLVDRHGQEKHVASTKVYLRDPIDGGRILRNDTRDSLFEWCGQNCEGAYWVGMGFAEFELEQDLLLFKMRWL